MALKFFGRGSGFSDEHTSAYFPTEDKKLVIIDCPVSTFHKVKHIDLTNCDELYVLVTHTHGDHVGGLGLLVQYAFFTLKKPITIVAPSSSVASDILLLMSIEGNEPSWFNIVTAEDMENQEWFGSTILTKHSPQLEGKCFGYELYVDGNHIVYTGDTSTLQPFIPFLSDNSILYVDTSVHYGMIHLTLEEALSDFISFTKRGIRVYLMHLDDAATAESIVADIPGIEVVSLD